MKQITQVVDRHFWDRVIAEFDDSVGALSVAFYLSTRPVPAMAIVTTVPDDYKLKAPVLADDDRLHGMLITDELCAMFGRESEEDAPEAFDALYGDDDPNEFSTYFNEVR